MKFYLKSKNEGLPGLHSFEVQPWRVRQLTILSLDNYDTAYRSHTGMLGL